MIADYFQKMYRTKPSERFVEAIEDMIYSININKTIIVSGFNSNVKNYSIDAASYALSV